VVGRALEHVEDLLPLDHLDGILLLLEQRADAGGVGTVGLVLDVRDLAHRLRDASALGQGLHAAMHLVAGFHDVARELPRRGPHGAAARRGRSAESPSPPSPKRAHSISVPQREHARFP
jgi:hypothetical protein